MHGTLASLAENNSTPPVRDCRAMFQGCLLLPCVSGSRFDRRRCTIVDNDRRCAIPVASNAPDDDDVNGVDSDPEPSLMLDTCSCCS
jgi:hypothetical protein